MSDRADYAISVEMDCSDIPGFMAEREERWRNSLYPCDQHLLVLYGTKNWLVTNSPEAIGFLVADGYTDLGELRDLKLSDFDGILANG